MSNWLIIRGSGLVAYALLATSVIWGLLLSTALLGRTVRAKGLTYVHEGLAVASLLATATHVGYVAVDDYVPFTVRELLVPGASGWRTDAVALGVVAMWLLFVVTVSFYIRPLIGQRVWRSVHYLGFGGFVAALGHGLLAGTDAAHPALLGLYAFTGAIVAALLAARVALFGERQRRRPQPAVSADRA